MNLTIGQIAGVVGASGQFDVSRSVNGYSIDSRTVAPGELFFAIKGDRFDGHEFVAGALERGAAGAVVRKDFTGSGNVLRVDDPLLALQVLAREVRRMWGRTVIGVTGSAGKTTTKEAIAHVLATKYKVLKSEGNLNNHFGLPMQLLRIQPETEIYVSEMGMNHAGEITALAKIAEPNVGVVTLVAPVHLEFFDSIEGIAKAKKELVDALPKDGVAILNADDPLVSKFNEGRAGRAVYFGTNDRADVRAVNVVEHGVEGVEFDVVAQGERVPARLPLVGKHNVHNALAAVAVGLEQGLTLKDAVGALASLVPADKRGEILEIGGATVVNDCYNSNPKALQSMVDALQAMQAKRHIVVAGEMLELGPSGEQLHRDCGRYMAERGVTELVGVRGLAKPMVEAAAASGLKAEFVESPEEAGAWLAANTKPGDAVLLKASRGVKLEKALEEWKGLVS
ncbi:MAG TPA: UDP-N-acetylmuramoyl-tripeptide--D-alanyl-D-alanine ligase [Terriglobales bacterium]|nr:UDP-N-acetylmuramoyl-tripeptide--D-alanyl-D-alanine ligase [Terriglobales bacterium]